MEYPVHVRLPTRQARDEVSGDQDANTLIYPMEYPVHVRLPTRQEVKSLVIRMPILSSIPWNTQCMLDYQTRQARGKVSGDQDANTLIYPMEYRVHVLRLPTRQEVKSLVIRMPILSSIPWNTQCMLDYQQGRQEVKSLVIRMPVL